MPTLHTLPEIERLRHRAGDSEFSPAIAKLRGETDAFLSSTISIPGRSAGFYHNYFCPEHAVELEFEPSLPSQHRCPRDGRVFSGEPFDSAWLWFINNRLSTMSLSLATRWCIEGDDRLLRRAVDVLCGYAIHYSSYEPEKPRPFGRGKATFQSLDEAVWLITLVRAYDLVHDALDKAKQKEIENSLLLPAAEHIRSQKYHRIHNIENWHNTALAAVALCVDDDELLRSAIEGEHGFHDQLARGVRNDGLWWEGSSSYHFYALAPLITLAQICSGHGLELWKNERFEKMFRTPIDLVLPDLRLPAGNDCWFFSSLTADVCHGVPPAAAFYEIAHAWYDDPAFGWVLSENYERNSRDSLEALFYGRSRITTSAVPSLTSVNFEPSGIALLRSFNDLQNQDCLLLKYGPHGGGHGHPDKLGTFVYAGGHDLSADLGTPGYGIKLNDSWFRQTLSHNTVTIDSQSQPPAQGKLVHFESNREKAVIDTRVDFVDPPYEGVSIRRVILWHSGYYVDFAHVVCQHECQIDLCHRFHADPYSACGLEPTTNRPSMIAGTGYEQIADIRSYIATTSAHLRWQLAHGSAALHLPDESHSEVIIGRVPYNPASETSTLTILRRHGSEAVFVSVMELSRDPPLIVTPLEGSPGELGGVFVDEGMEMQAFVFYLPGHSEPEALTSVAVTRYLL